jgi:dihydrofolate reductase/DNA-binding MarR family transcriptional regulator
MVRPRRTPAGEAFTDLVVEIAGFGAFITAAGEALARVGGQTLARWVILDSIEDGPATVAQLARRRGIARQAVQRVADLLVGDGLAAYESNPRHRRARLLRSTPRGRRVLRAISEAQQPWRTDRRREAETGARHGERSRGRGRGGWPAWEAIRRARPSDLIGPDGWRMRSRTRRTRRTLEMATIVVSDNVSLDGVIQDPAGDEGFSRGGWVGLIKDRPELAKLTLDEALSTDAMLMGRRTYEWFAGRWPSRSGALADRLNGLPKYVVSSTLDDPTWNNSTVVRGDVLAEVSRLSREFAGDIVIPASFRIVRTLMEHDLVDTMRLKVFPVVLGAGERLFGETSGKRPMRLVDTRTLDGDTVFLTYARV